MLDNLRLENSPSPEVSRSSRLIVTVAAFAMGGASIYTLQRFKGEEIAKAPPKPIPAIPQIKTVTALGRLEPKGEVIQLSAPAIGGEGSRVEQLLVREGDRVKADQVIAVLDSRDRLMAAFKEAKESVRVAQANLKKVKGGAKQGDIEAQKAGVSRLQVEKTTEIKAQLAAVNRLQVEKSTETKAQQAAVNRLQAEKVREIEAQRATIARLEAELENARLEYQRYDGLYKAGAISTSLRDSKNLVLQTSKQQLAEARANLQLIKSSKEQQLAEAQANLERIQSSRQQQLVEAEANLERIQLSLQQQINQGKATLESIVEVRPVDVLVAQAEVNRAVAAMNRAEADLKQAYVRSPQEGQIFDIHTRPGEKVVNEGIVDIGQTSTMYAVVEVYQSDVNNIRLGQQVELLADAIPGRLNGIVDQIGLQVQRQNVVNSDPSTNIDSRIVEVHVRLDDESSEKAARFTNLQVRAVVEI
ncbi:biotin/lipoyl-binding protein [Rivularia sp. UHCC 0363]|uniref:HlyD family efflux transporter periplasmic adaptor subunit n=1 Tax=Rivularia sp. UHCC 0363 TaxID=3110244 RepID=UPI002B21119E|nr:biotin/lipoyl-binding protein [Rivularia sp. UHCC 0363]MEA5599384.1 biotin/lipoyl-binding protein [Rivularia sp. UHCC 0363]